MENKKSLALVMIVKNEELGLEAAIKSCKDFVDEIVIAVDNSSADKTEEIAKKYATTVKHFDWSDDFAAARNFAQQNVKSDWILFLDGHEFVQKCEYLQEYLNKDCDALICTIEMENNVQFRNPRIYKNGVKFEGAVHESQILKNPIWYPYFVVKHDRKKSQSQTAVELRDKQRDEQVPRIFKSRLKKNPKDLKASFHLALFYQTKGDFKKTMRYQNCYLKYAIDKGERWFVYFNRATYLLEKGKLFRALWAAENAEKEMPGRWETTKLKGLIFYAKKDLVRALDNFVGSFHTNSGYVSYNPWPREDGNTWSLIGECFFSLGEYFKAASAFDRAAELSKDQMFKDLHKKRSELMTKIATKNPQ